MTCEEFHLVRDCCVTSNFRRSTVVSCRCARVEYPTYIELICSGFGKFMQRKHDKVDVALVREISASHLLRRKENPGRGTSQLVDVTMGGPA